MKSIRVIFTIWLVLLACLVGCSKEKDSKKVDNNDAKIMNNESNKKNKTKKEKVDKENKDIKEKALELGDFSTIPTIKDTVVVDEKDVKVIVKNLRYNSYEAMVDICVENNRNKKIFVTAGTMRYSCNAINHFMLEDGFLNLDVPKEESATDGVTFNIKNMSMLGITKISDIYIGFSIEDEDNKIIYEGGKIIKTSEYEEYNAKKDSYIDIIKNGILEKEFDCKILKIKDKKIKLKDGVDIVSQVFVENKEKKKSVFVEFENSSKKHRQVSIGDVDINSTNVFDNIVDSETMMPNSRVVIEMSVDDLLEFYNKDNDKDIDKNKIDEISYKVKLYKDGFKEYFSSKRIKF